MAEYEVCTIYAYIHIKALRTTTLIVTHLDQYSVYINYYQSNINGSFSVNSKYLTNSWIFWICIFCVNRNTYTPSHLYSYPIRNSCGRSTMHKIMQVFPIFMFNVNIKHLCLLVFYALCFCFCHELTCNCSSTHRT